MVKSTTNPQEEIDILRATIDSSLEGIKKTEDEITRLLSNIEVLAFYLRDDKSLAATTEEITIKLKPDKEGVLKIKIEDAEYSFKTGMWADLYNLLANPLVKKFNELINVQVKNNQNWIVEANKRIGKYKDDIAQYEKMKEAMLFSDEKK